MHAVVNGPCGRYMYIQTGRQPHGRSRNQRWGCWAVAMYAGTTCLGHRGYRLVSQSLSQCLSFTGKVAVITTILINLACGMVKFFVVW